MTLVWSNTDYARWSEYVIAGDRVVFIGKHKDQAPQLIALRLGDGKLAFASALARPLAASATVAVVGDHVIVADEQTYETFASSDGKSLGVTRVVKPGAAEGIYAGAQPAQANGLVVFGGEFYSRLIAVKTDGTVAWRVPARGSDKPQVITIIARGELVLSYGTGELVATAIADGAERWRIKLATPLGSAMATLRDTLSIDQAFGELAFGLDGNVLYAVDAASGASRWRYPAHAAPSFVVDGAIVVASDGQNVVGLDRLTGQQRWSHASAASIAMPAGRGAVVIAGAGKATALNTSDGKILGEASASTGDHLRVLAAHAGRAVFADSDHASLVELDGGSVRVTPLRDQPSFTSRLADRRLSATDPQRAVLLDAVTETRVLVGARSGAIDAFR